METDSRNAQSDALPPGSLCWTTPRPFEPSALMLVLGCRSSAAAVVEVPLSASSEGGEDSLVFALKQIQPKSLVAVNARRLGPPVGRITPQQYADVRDGLRDWLTVAVA